MHEIVTLQFGQQANYVGTHYWNTQESYFTYSGEAESPVNHDISFRAGVGADGADTYTPRTLIYDLKGAFGTLRRENALYELQHNPAQDGQWRGSTVPLQLPPIAPSPYQQALDQDIEPPVLTTETVRFWSDYNHVFYHPRSIVQMNEYELNSSLMPFEQWQKGDELFANLDREYDLLDRDLRPFLEECDHLQAVQVFSGIDDAWGGFAARYLERVSDELGKGCRWVFGLQDSRRTSRERQAVHLANVAQSFYALGSSASMHIPLASIPASLPEYLSMNDSSRWYTSALQSLAIESVTLPTRLRETDSARATFDHLEATIDGDGKRRIAACNLSATDPEHLAASTGANGHDARMSNGSSHALDDEDTEHAEDKLDIAFYPELPSQPRRSSTTRRRTHVFSSIATFRGTWKAATEIRNANATTRDRFAGTGRKTSQHQTSLLFPLLASYPSICRFAERPRKLAINVNLSASTEIAGQIRGMEGIARRLIGLEEREALCDGLATMADEYEEDWRSEGESDDD